METSDVISTNGELETRRVKEINDNDLDSAPIKVSKRRRPKFGDHHDLESMKSNIHDKGTQLSTVWNELYNLLGDYQAKLFSREGEFLASKAKYDAVTDMDQLRNDLISKDNEVKELKERLSVMESRSETIQLDLSVKNSLLKKYQQDLLEKEAALLNLQSANKKLENRVQALEMKLAGAASVAISSQNPQPGTSGVRQSSTPPQLKRRGALPPQHSTPKRRPLLPAIAPKPAVNLEPETREEDTSQKFSPPSDARDNNVENRENENSVNIPLYAEQWIKSETPTTMDEDENSNQNVFPGNENESEDMAQWQGQDSGLDGEGSLMIDSPSNKTAQYRPESPHTDETPGILHADTLQPADRLDFVPRIPKVEVSDYSYKADGVELSDSPQETDYLAKADLDTLAKIASLDPDALRAANLDPETFRSSSIDFNTSLPARLHQERYPQTAVTVRNPYGLPNGAKKYQCKQCYVCFANSLDLFEHTRQVHAAALYHCRYPGCTKAYTRSYALAQHMQAHSGKMFQCQACHKTFPMRRGYYQHVTQFCKLAKQMKMNGTWQDYVKQ